MKKGETPISKRTLRRPIREGVRRHPGEVKVGIMRHRTRLQRHSYCLVLKRKQFGGQWLADRQWRGCERKREKEGDEANQFPV